MKGRWRWIVISANLVVLLVLAFVYPHLMVSPGPLIPGHAELTGDCFACHAPMRGASPERCIVCHAVSDIGRLSTSGAPIQASHSGSRAAPLLMSFHQELTEQDCMACHSDHAGPRLNQRNHPSFSHALLRLTMRGNCATCHAAPSNAMHQNLSVGCAQCHRTEGWKPASFDHAALSQAELGHCETCHKAPTNALHRKISGNCAQCHSPKAWEPATFEHDRHFVLDGDHNASCSTCDDYSNYTCFGCHEHTPSKVRSEHIGEGIRNFDNCVECHRSAAEGSEGNDRRENDRGERD